MTRMLETHLSNFSGFWVMCWTQVSPDNELFKDTLHLPAHLPKLRMFLHDCQSVLRLICGHESHKSSDHHSLLHKYPKERDMEKMGKARPREEGVKEHLCNSLPLSLL